MSKQQMIQILKSFQKSPAKSKMRQDYFGMFINKMVYRTTKSENSEVTQKMVKKVLQKA
ncbi:MAG: hypothetical protein Q7U36_00345 [bacterium]|nr:hypothetical protein [bacterium]